MHVRLIPILLLAFVASACAPAVGIRRQDPERTYVRLHESAIRGSSLSLSTLVVLADLDLEGNEPLRDILRILDGTDLFPRWETDLAGAEVAFRAAKRARTAPPELLLTCALRSLRAFEGLASPSIADPRHARIVQLYNAAVSRLIIALQDARGRPENWKRLSDLERDYLLEPRQPRDGWAPGYFDEFFAADGLRVVGMRSRHRLHGWGAPLAGLRENRPPVRASSPHYPPEGILYPVTALILPGASPDVLALELHDPMRSTTVVIGGRPQPLAGDLTAPYATLLDRAKLHRLKSLGLLRADEAKDHQGIFLLEPYDPAKIPVVLVHGLWSSPFTWHELTNDIWGDPVLRAGFQVWHYFYPTGAPILAAALDLREALAETRRFFDPDENDPAWSDVVLVGHSLGGVLARMLVSHSGEAIWESKHRRPLDELELSDEDRQRARAYFYFEPLPYVRRVVFIGTPHRGSRTADGLVGRIGAALVTVPRDVVGWVERLLEANPDVLHEGVYTKAPSSIDALSPSNVVLRAVAELPIAAGVAYHSIRGASDRVVPVESSRIAGAESDLVLPGKHDVQESPLAVAEVRRILRLHLAEKRKRAAEVP